MSVFRSRSAAVGAGVEQRRHVAGGNRGLAGHVAGAAGNAAGNAVLVDRAGLLRRRSRRRVVVDRDDQAVGGGGDRVAVGIGRLDDRAEIDRQIVLGVVTGCPLACMVELVDQGEGLGAGGAVQREREHRVGARRGGQRVADHRVGDGDAARGQRRQAGCVGLQPVGQRRVGAGVEQPRHVAGGNRGLAGHVAGAAGNAAGNAVLVDRAGQRAVASRRRVVVDRDDQAVGGGGDRVAVGIGRLDDRAEIDRQIVLVVVTELPVRAWSSWSTRVKVQAPVVPLTLKVNTVLPPAEAVSVLPTTA